MEKTRWLLFGVLLVLLLGAPGLAQEEFSIIVLPDTQIYSQSYPEIFISQAQWIVDMAEDLNIRLVLHAGDVVNQGARSESQWQNAKAAIDIIDQAGIPCFIAIGNHDYNDEAQTRNSAKFNEYFGLERYLGKPWFGGAFEPGKADNVYGFIEAGGRRYLVLALEFGPRRAVLQWANEVVAQYPDHEVIVVTHCHMYTDNTPMGQGHYWNPKDYGVGYDAHDGEGIWQEFLRRHPNVRFVLSGHVLNSGVGRRIDVGDHGNLVYQILANYQMRPYYGGEGFLRIMTFRPAEGVVEVQTYSPHFDRYLTEPDQTFTLAYDPDSRPVASGWLEGALQEVIAGRGISEALLTVYSATGELYGGIRPGEDGSFAMRLPVGAYMLQVTADGYEESLVPIEIGSEGLNLAVPLMPLPYAEISVAGETMEQNSWAGWLAGDVVLTFEVGPPEILAEVVVDLSQVLDGELVPVERLYVGSQGPEALLIDTLGLIDGSYQLAVLVSTIGGTTGESVVRFGVRNWVELVDDFLPPLPLGWFGQQERKETYSESSGWDYATEDPAAFFGDDHRLVSSVPERQWLVWQLAGLREYSVTVYAKETGVAGLGLAVSADGLAWQDLAWELVDHGTSAAGWRKLELVGTVAPEARVNYFRLTLLPGEPPTGIQLGQVVLRALSRD